MAIEVQRSEIQTSVPAFATLEELNSAMAAKESQCSGVRLYPRDGTPELAQLEGDIEDMLGVRGGHLLLYGNGMSAVRDALDALDPTFGTRILRGNQHYSQAGKIITEYLGTGRGARVSLVDPGSIKEVEKELREQRPQIIFFETVTNNYLMATLEIERFLDLPILQELNPVVILDNTLPTSTGIPLGRIMESSDRRVVGVESGTKYIGLNGEMCGMIYTYNEKLLDIYKKRRQAWGSLLCGSAIATVRRDMPQTAGEYHLRNKAVFQHTLRLARACARGLENEEKFIVVHPNLLDHPNSRYTNLCAPEGISPVLFIGPVDITDIDVLEAKRNLIARRLDAHPVIRRLADVDGPYGQSFGFARLRILTYEHPVIRISGGIYSEEEQAELDEAFYEALSGIG